ncbi:MAG: TolC family protein [Candidatus Schekmanbacteria bacterium]|nr:TolC family protein [Candidatus Schekmanbacteria bacterium]
MGRRFAALVALVMLSTGPPPCCAEQAALSFGDALELARVRAAAAQAARARIDEARARLLGASLRLAQNPLLETAAGTASDGETAVELDVRQPLALGGRRAARIAAAEAGVDRAAAEYDEAVRGALREVALAFLRALHAQERLRLARQAEEVATEVVRITERRHQAGELAVLELNLARATLAHARADGGQAMAAGSLALGELRVLLDMPPETRLDLAGTLREQVQEVVAESAAPPERADLRVLGAELREARAEALLAAAERLPETELGLRYERDGDTETVLGAVSLTLPVFNRGQASRAEASARVGRLAAQLDAARRAARSEVAAAQAAAAQLRAAVATLEDQALPILDDNERLARRSYEEGELGLAELLLVRRETLELRQEYLDHLLAAAAAAVELRVHAGALP